jgi:hypothetical protein
MIRPEIFPKIFFPDFNQGKIAADPPPGIGPPQKFYEQNIAGWRGLPVGDLSISQAHLTPFLGCPPCGPWWGYEWPSAL